MSQARLLFSRKAEGCSKRGKIRSDYGRSSAGGGERASRGGLRELLRALAGQPHAVGHHVDDRAEHREHEDPRSQPEDILRAWP